VASQHGAPPRGLTREQRIADAVLRRGGYSPPVPVDAIAREFAAVEFEFIPGRCDGLILGLNSHVGEERPTIVVAAQSPFRRQRFTVGHELGHLMLPWHAGTALACDTRALLTPAAAWEQQANLFAAELLLPTAWLREVVARYGGSVRDVIREVEVANASAHASCIALCRVLPAGHVWALLDDDDRVLAWGCSPGSSAEPLAVGAVPDFDLRSRFANEAALCDFAGRRVAWWVYTHETVPRPEVLDPAALLDEILAFHIPDSASRRKVRQSMAGIAGAAKSLAKDSSDEEEVYARLRRAFSRRRDEIPESLLEDARFEAWLAARAHQLVGSP